MVERAVLLCEADTIGADDLPDDVVGGAAQFPPVLPDDDLSVKKATRKLEAHLIARALQRTRGNRTRAARLLEISHRALLYKMRDYGVDYRPQDDR